MNQPSPLAASASVSVLVRTTGRASLQAAIDSVRRQQFTDWQLLVLNASGAPIPGLDALLQGIAARAIEPGVRLPRAEAANALLAAVDTPFALFLDDDDWLLPGHLQKLADVLRQRPALAAAYGDVACVADAGQPGERTLHTFAQTFDAAALQLQNYLPIHAVLFRMDAVRAQPPCRFDATLELFEDWDFWLQLASRGPFERIPGVSAVYAIDPEQGSGHAAQGARREVMLQAIAARQLARWQPADVARLIQRDAGRNDALNDAAQQLAAARREVLELRRQVLELGRETQSLMAQIAQIRASTSWRITEPVRAAGGYARKLGTPLRLARALPATLLNETKRHGMVGLLRRVPYYLRHREAYLARLASRPGQGGNPFGAAQPAIVRDLPLHPDLEDAPATIDAKVSVVIPTLNAGPEFGWMLRKLRTQRGLREVEIVVVDSGSTDGTDTLAEAMGATVVRIPPSEFSHSHARNLGARNATGDYLLFTVQDAFPIGQHWLHAMLRHLRDPANAGLAAVSCSEFSRSDSDLMYDAMIDTHYRFLGCLEQDRAGRHTGDDHMSLRSQGQLSDVACLIPRALFAQFGYRGDYAEDLDLGIRLIRAGWQVAMLASVKVVHSHNRPAYYYLKRSYVDVVFLVGMFDDFTYPACPSLPGLAGGVASAARHASRWIEAIGAAPEQELTQARFAEWIARWRAELNAPTQSGAIGLHDARLENYIGELARRHPMAAAPDAAARDAQRMFADMFAGRLDNVLQFAARVYDGRDLLPRAELAGMLAKTLAATAGSALAFHGLDQRKPGAPGEAAAREIHQQLAAGV
jgi:glycosyltransferase involved in cell wall biosynthesis